MNYYFAYLKKQPVTPKALNYLTKTMSNGVRPMAKAQTDLKPTLMTVCMYTRMYNVAAGGRSLDRMREVRVTGRPGIRPLRVGPEANPPKVDSFLMKSRDAVATARTPSRKQGGEREQRGAREVWGERCAKDPAPVGG